MIMFSSMAQKRRLRKLSTDYATTLRGDKFCNYSIAVSELEYAGLKKKSQNARNEMFCSCLKMYCK